MTDVKPPNVLLVMTDQHRADHTGFGGDPIVQTPHLDAIAARGVRFTRAHVANPVCMPSRASMMTGRMPSASGSTQNGIALDPDAATFVRSLRDSGYRTGLVGKSHLQNNGIGFSDARPAPPMQPAASAINHAAGWDQWEMPDRYLDADVTVAPDFYGFDHVEFAIGHGDAVSGHYLGWLRDRGVAKADFPQPRRYGPEGSTWADSQTPAELYPTTFVTERGLDFIEAGAQNDQPWMLQLSYPDPHHPFTPPGRYADMYDPADIVLPSTWDNPHEQSSMMVKMALNNRGIDPGSVMFWAPNEEQFRIMAARQHGMISMIDDGVGQVVAALERTGQLDDTIIVFVSDHGDMMGDHGLVLKMFLHYRAVVNIPMVIAGPGIEPGVSHSLVQLIDLPATIIDLCGSEGWAGLQGRSLRPSLDDPAGHVHRDHILIEDDSTVMDPFQTGHGARMRSIITDDYRLTRTLGSPTGELYAYDTDPDERDNRFNDPDAQPLRASAFEQLAEAMIAADAPDRVATHLA